MPKLIYTSRLTRCRADKESDYSVQSGRKLQTSCPRFFRVEEILTAPSMNSRCAELGPEEGSPRLSVIFCAMRVQTK